MAKQEPAPFFGLGEGCPVHGDEFMKECSMCGAEFCARCHPRWTVCADCADEPSEDLRGEEADFEDVRDLGALFEDEGPLSDTLEEGDDDFPADDLPPGDAEDRF